jgi:hypothetical protein
MKIVEFEWIKKNTDLLSDEDREELKELGVFMMMRLGEINLPLPKAVELFKRVSEIVGKYTEDEENVLSTL